ncbi:MAG: lipid A biosynthesis acyltransferase [Oleiphilaceae bacterium]|nr:lipid A biosynthesis acyltransferase [Oleiphilaceae bacterium]
MSQLFMHLALLVARGIAFLPWRMQCLIGAGFGQLCYYTLKRRRHVCLTNIKHCFPELDAAQQQVLVRKAFRANGIGIMEALRSWFRDPKSLADKTRVEGLEYLQQAQARGRGVILLGGHYTTLDLAGSLTTLYFKADIMQRDHANPVFNRFVRGSREKLYGTVLGKNDVRGLLRCLRQNHIVWYATDQDAGRQNSVFAPFFGIPAATLVSTMRLAKRSGAAVVPFSHFRLPGNQGYVLRMQPALEDFPTGDDLADAARLNHIIEENVRCFPEQYLWLHRRFKTPPERDVLNIYGQRRDAPG